MKCKCGCGQDIEIKKHHKYYGIPEYISGHNTIIKNPMNTDEAKEKISKANKGRKHSEEFKKKCSERMKGKKSFFKGRKHSEKSKQKISVSRIGKCLEEEHPSWVGGIYHTWHKKAWKLFGKDYCENCEMTNDHHKLKWKTRLHMHNTLYPKDYTIMEEYAWETYCLDCHNGLEHALKYDRN